MKTLPQVDPVHNQWQRNGDHPLDGNEVFAEGEFKGQKYEGKLVRYFRHPEVDGQAICPECGKTYHEHGWLEDKNVHRFILRDIPGLVCPGSWLIHLLGTEEYLIVSDKAYHMPVTSFPH